MPTPRRKPVKVIARKRRRITANAIPSLGGAVRGLGRGRQARDAGGVSLFGKITQAITGPLSADKRLRPAAPTRKNMRRVTKSTARSGGGRSRRR